VKLPPGPHEIELAHSGFLPYRAQVDIDPGKLRRLHVEMEPTAEALHERIDRASGQRWRAWGTVAAGALIAGGGATYLWWALKNRDQANREFNSVQDSFKTGNRCDPKGNAAADCADLKSDAETRQTNAGYHLVGSSIATGVGAAVMVTGLILVLTVDDTSRYETPHSSVAWLGWANAKGGGVALAGRF
jgi:hypothetical protein